MNLLIEQIAVEDEDGQNNNILQTFNPEYYRMYTFENEIPCLNATSFIWISNCIFIIILPETGMLKSWV